MYALRRRPTSAPGLYVSTCSRMSSKRRTMGPTPPPGEGYYAPEGSSLRGPGLHLLGDRLLGRGPRRDGAFPLLEEPLPREEDRARDVHRRVRSHDDADDQHERERLEGLAPEQEER